MDYVPPTEAPLSELEAERERDENLASLRWSPLAVVSLVAWAAALKRNPQRAPGPSRAFRTFQGGGPGVTVTSGRRRASILGPTPRTARRSSTRRNGP